MIRHGPKLEKEYRIATLRYDREHAQWADEAWRKVMFPDESRFKLYAHDKRRRVYRQPGDRFVLACFEEKVPVEGGCVTLFLVKYYTYLNLNSNFATGKCYTTKILFKILPTGSYDNLASIYCFIPVI